MGLTLHYRLHAASESARAARELVEQLRDRALCLPFAEVGPIETLARSSLREPDEESPLGLDAIEMLRRGENYYDVPPLRGFGFFVDPGPGCETAAFGLAEYPKSILLPNLRRLRTRLVRLVVAQLLQDSVRQQSAPRWLRELSSLPCVARRIARRRR